MWQLVVLSASFLIASSSAGSLDSLTNSLIQQFMTRFGDNQNQRDEVAGMIQNDDQNHHTIRVAKDSSDFDLHPLRFQMRDDILLPHEPSPRKEYLEHSSLWGHQYMQGGAGEGSQRLKPDGSIKNIQVIKTDAVLPAYCNPPNPCPLGYTASDGCLEDFENTAAFSREYQASQECMCDTEHMFDCPGNTDENELETLARSIQNEGVMDSTINKIVDSINDHDHKVVAKKFFSKKSHDYLKNESINKAISSAKHERLSLNPYLTGDKLPVVAKKTPHTAKGI